MATSSSSKCICLGFSAPSKEPDLASLPDPLRLLAPPNAPEPLESACACTRIFTDIIAAQR